jgi:hypothetical protein
VADTTITPTKKSKNRVKSCTQLDCVELERYIIPVLHVTLGLANRTSLIIGYILEFFGVILFILSISKNLKRLEHFLGLGWDVTGVGDVHHLARFIFLIIDSSIKWSKLDPSLAERLDFFGVILFILCTRKDLKRLEHFVGLGWNATGVGVVHHLARFIF